MQGLLLSLVLAGCSLGSKPNPAIAHPWDASRLPGLRDEFVTLYQAEQPLPALSDPDVGRLTDVGGALQYARNATLFELFPAWEVLQQIRTLYAHTEATDGQATVTMVSLNASALALGVAVLEALAAERPPKRLLTVHMRPDDPVANLRYSLSRLATESMSLLTDHPGAPPERLVRKGVVPALETLIPWLLPEERDALRGQAKGVQPALRAVLLASLDVDAPLHPVVGSIVDDFRAFNEVMAVRVERAAERSSTTADAVGPEGNGVRYRFPGRSLSAVFHSPPSAYESVAHRFDDGVRETRRELRLKDGTGLELRWSCVSRAEPYSGSHPFKPGGINLLPETGLVEVEVDGNHGWEHRLNFVGDRLGVERVIPVGNGGCEAGAYYHRSVGNTTTEARILMFLDSLRADSRSVE